MRSLNDNGISLDDLTAHPDYEDGYTIGMDGGEYIPDQSYEWREGFKNGKEHRDLIKMINWHRMTDKEREHIISRSSKRTDHLNKSNKKENA